MSRNTFQPSTVRSGVGCGYFYLYKGIKWRPHYRISFVILVECGSCLLAAAQGIQKTEDIPIPVIYRKTFCNHQNVQYICYIKAKIEKNMFTGAVRASPVGLGKYAQGWQWVGYGASIIIPLPIPMFLMSVKSYPYPTCPVISMSMPHIYWADQHNTEEWWRNCWIHLLYMCQPLRSFYGWRIGYREEDGWAWSLHTYQFRVYNTCYPLIRWLGHTQPQNCIHVLSTVSRVGFGHTAHGTKMCPYSINLDDVSMGIHSIGKITILTFFQSISFVLASWGWP